MVEMMETANILNNATPRSLVILDEIGRGTSTFDGLSIAWAVAEYLHDQEEVRAKTLFATHYHELTELALTLKRIKNFHVAVKEWKDEVIFLRKIVPGRPTRATASMWPSWPGSPRRSSTGPGRSCSTWRSWSSTRRGRPGLAYRCARPPGQVPAHALPGGQGTGAPHGRSGTRSKLAISPALTPLEALNLLNALKEKLRES